MYRDIKYPYEGADSVNINLIYVKLRKTQTAILKLNEDGTYTILVNSNKICNARGYCMN